MDRDRHNFRIMALTAKEKELWDRVSEYARNCSWQTTGEFLADKMKRSDFLEWERVFAALDRDKIAGFCALTKSSAVLGEKYSPYIGFLFVDEKYRGNHLGRQLCKAAVDYSASLDFAGVYLYSDLTDYYEKMGFEKIGEEDTPWGVPHSVYAMAAKTDRQMSGRDSRSCRSFHS